MLSASMFFSGRSFTQFRLCCHLNLSHFSGHKATALFIWDLYMCDKFEKKNYYFCIKKNPHVVLGGVRDINHVSISHILQQASTTFFFFKIECKAII